MPIPRGFTLVILYFLVTVSSCTLADVDEPCANKASTTNYCSGDLCCSHGGYPPPSSSSTLPPSSHHRRRRRRGHGRSSLPKSRVSALITSRIFDQFFSNRSISSCPSHGFYTYDDFIHAADAYKDFGTSGSLSAQKQEMAAFFANIGHETSRGCYVEEIVKGVYCNTSLAPCAKGQEYYGRGPIQLSWNYNYQAAGMALGFDGIDNPGIVASNATISFETAVWYWMSQGSPSCHGAIVGGHGFGATINAINGGLECGPTANLAEQQDRISLYKSFCSTLGVSTGKNLTC